MSPPSREDIKYKAGGRAGSGVAAVSKLTSVCGMSLRWGRVQPHSTQELPVAHQPKPGTGGV